MRGEHGRKTDWAPSGLLSAVALSAGCNVLLDINDYSDKTSSTTLGSGGATTSSGGSSGATSTGGAGGTTSEGGSGGTTSNAGSGGAQGGASGSTGSGNAGGTGGVGGAGGVTCADVSGDCGKHIWSKSVGPSSPGPSDQAANGVALNMAGDVFVVGTFDTELDFGPSCGSLISQGSSDAFFAKLASNGNWVQFPGCTQRVDENRDESRV